MRVYMAGIGLSSFYIKKFIEHKVIDLKRINVLESFYYIEPWEAALIPDFKEFILDSGAFTFMSGGSKTVDFETYTKKYGAFIKKHRIKRFFELDVDGVIGFEKYLELRKLLEDITGLDPVPVMHRSRGKEYFLDAVKRHERVAVGGIAIGHIRRSEYACLPWFITEAHKAGAKIHGLGFTYMNFIKAAPFDSVDSSTWSYGQRAGSLYHFNGSAIKAYKKKTTRLNSAKAAVHNFEQWILFSEYMERF
jgi:hypothetical protein